jgi:multidrug efflux system membrane fusion protein
MAANVTFDFASENQSEYLIVAARAIGEDQDGNFAFVLEQENDYYVAKRTTLKIGQLTPQGFEVLEGLEEGQLIVTAGLQTLLNGMKVKLFDN